MGKRTLSFLLICFLVLAFSLSAENLELSGFDSGDWNNVARGEDGQGPLGLVMFADNFEDGSMDTPGMTNVSGTWKVEDGQLLAVERPSWSVRMLVGDTTWQDYTMKLRMMPMQGGWHGLIFRAGNNYQRLEFNFDGNRYRIIDNSNNEILPATTIPHTFVNKKWYDLTLTVIGNNVSFKIEDEDKVLVESTATLPAGFESGRPGLIAGAATQTSPIHFDDIVVFPKGSSQVAHSGTFTSAVTDLGANRSLTKISWNSTEPADTRLRIKVRASDSPFTMADTEPQWVDVVNGQESDLPQGRYIQYQAIFQANPARTVSPLLHSVTAEAGTKAAFMGVVTGAGAPVAGAVVELFEDGRPLMLVYTDQLGQYDTGTTLLKDNVSYSLKVTAPGFIGESVILPTDGGTKQQDVDLPPAAGLLPPENFEADSDAKPGAIVLSWDYSEAASAFRIWRKQEGEGFLLLATIGGSTFSYTDLAVLSGEEYSYAVSAVLASGAESPVAVSAQVLVRQGEGVAKGVVLDEYQNPIAGAVVKVGDKEAVTDIHGAYLIDKLLIGTYQLTVSKPGYESASVEITIYTQMETVADLTLNFNVGETETKTSYFDVYPQFINKSSQQQVNFTFSVASESTVTISIYSLDGYLVKTLLKDEPLYSRTPYFLSWDLEDRNGRSVPTGLYLALFQVKPNSAHNEYKVVKRIAIFK